MRNHRVQYYSPAPTDVFRSHGSMSQTPIPRVLTALFLFVLENTSLPKRDLLLEPSEHLSGEYSCPSICVRRD
jgi:hypothetical protein